MGTDYGRRGKLVRGSLWPPGGDAVVVRLIRSSGWAGADSWTWTLRFSRNVGSGSPDFSIESSSISISGTSIYISYKLDDSDTVVANFPETGQTNVGVRSVDGSDNVSDWEIVRGYIEVVDPIGEAA
jgi:hypothetical protein